MTLRSTLARHWKLIVVSLGLWILVALPMTFDLYDYLRDSKPLPFAQLLVIQLARYSPFAILIPTVYWIAGRFSPSAATLGIHLGVCLLYGAISNFTLTAVERQLRDDERSFVDSYVALLPRRLGYGVVVYLFVLAGAQSAHYYRRSEERKVANAQLERQLAEARLMALSNQLRPHFLFNTLHAISSLMEDDVKEARRTMALLGELLRVSLEHDEQNVPLSRELETLELYLSIERVRFQDRLAVETAIAPDAREAVVPHFVLQPVVENAIRHGIGAQSTAGTISIQASVENGSLTLVVDDDGPGCPIPVARGVGLTNLAERLGQLYGDASKLDLSSPEGGGFRATLSIPYRAASAGDA